MQLIKQLLIVLLAGTYLLMGEATTTAEKGNKVDFSGDDNITVARNDKNISLALKKDLTGLNSASFNNAAGNQL